MPLTEAKGSVGLVLSLVMVSTGRKMVPVPRLCCSARRSCRSPRPVKPLQSHRVGELQLERGWEGLEGFSSLFGGHKPLSQSDKRGSPVLWGDGPTELLDPSPGAVECRCPRRLGQVHGSCSFSSPVHGTGGPWDKPPGATQVTSTASSCSLCWWSCVYPAFWGQSLSWERQGAPWKEPLGRAGAGRGFVGGALQIGRAHV